MQVLLGKGVQESRILFLTLIAAPEGLHNICTRFPKLTVVTSGGCVFVTQTLLFVLHFTCLHRFSKVEPAVYL